MRINLDILLVVMAYVVMEILFSVLDESERKQATEFPLWKHGGVWGDLLLFSVINAIVWNHLRLPGLWLFAVIIVISVVATLGLHKMWFDGQGMTSGFWRFWPKGGCFGGMGLVGWMHVFFMMAQLTILLLFVLSPAPAKVIWTAAIMLTVFWPLGVIQPCWYLTGKWLDPMAVTNSAIMVIGTWGACWLKIVRPEWLDFFARLGR